MTTILRVFPRRTNATPTDDLVRIGDPGLFDPPECDVIHISVAFSWDLKAGERLTKAWGSQHPHVFMGGPACGDPGVEFVPGRYLKKGHVITSRGCPNSCWFCDVPQREGTIWELAIKNGHIIHDSNLLACSKTHIRSVFEMLRRQPERAQFVGGLEAARLEPWHVEELTRTRTDRMFFAYDTPDDHEPLVNAGRTLTEAGFTRHHLCAYVLIGYAGDRFFRAEKRLRDTWAAGFMPFAMLYHGRARACSDPEWRRFQRVWTRPAIIRSRMKGDSAA